MHAPASRGLAALLVAAAIATGPAALAKPVVVVDRGPTLEGKPEVDNIRIRDLGSGYVESASSQFSTAGLDVLLKELSSRGYDPKRHYLVIVDLRQESHGTIAGHAVRWMESEDADLLKYDWINIGRPHQDIVGAERGLLEKAALAKDTRFYTLAKAEKNAVPTLVEHAPINAKDDSFATETELVDKALGPGHAIRLTVPDHKKPEDDAEVDLFFAELARVYRDAGNAKLTPWIHFHCAAGQGRTTTFMALYDFYVHAVVTRQAMPFETIPLSQIDPKFPPAFEDYLLQQKVPKREKTSTMPTTSADGKTVLYTSGKGGADITLTGAIKVREEDERKGLAAIDRFHFIANFYWYLANTPSDQRPAWSTWARAHKCALADAKQDGTYPYCTP